MLTQVRIFLCVYLLFVLFVFSEGLYLVRSYDYYSDKDNYVEASGKLTSIRYSEKGDVLYLTFENLEPEFSDTCFKITGDSLTIVRENGIDEKIELGMDVEFISATRYFGDGYVMPIVGITVNDEVLLEFDEGYENLLNYLR